MLQIPGYIIGEQLHNGNKTRVYRGIATSNQKPVVIKILTSDSPTLAELVQFRNQHLIAKKIKHPQIVKHLSLEKYGNSFAIIMEDFGGWSLAQYLANRISSHQNSKIKFFIKEYIHIAIQIVCALEGMAPHRIIHKDIKPDNIVINPQTMEVKLIDFSIASLLPKENQEIANPNILEGTLAYMSPEQTGRMNRGIDYRSDFYSLGVTLYELLTGQLPFQSTDPMELVHCHIARKPTPPIEVNPAIPLVLSDMVMKLMAKTAEERYQSAFGIRYDLERCWQEYEARGTISVFELATRDVSDRFLIPEKLYGRETEVQSLLQAFARVSQGHKEIILVAGFSGIGKTAVVAEVHKPIVRQRGYFIKGKFDQFKRDIPLSAWVQALQNLIRQILAEPPRVLAAWKTAILAALEAQAQVIIDVIPELELLLSQQPPIAELEGTAAQNRFNLLFAKFIQVFATAAHPLVIFLDDLQWADTASLQLLKLLSCESDTRYLLLVGAYRDNEVSEAHPLMLTLAEITKQSATAVNQITLAPLDKNAMNHLVADTLSCPLPLASPLTELVFAKTQGNPFFTNQFLKYLHEEGFIRFDMTRGYWQCDLARVRMLAASDDVVEFVAAQLQKLPPDTQRVLQLAACIGNLFELGTLAVVYQKSIPDTAADLWSALADGLVVPETDMYKFFSEGEEESLGNISTAHGEFSVFYRFLHDRVQQAANFLIPEAEKQATHLKIGRLLLQNSQNLTEDEWEEAIFDTVNQLNLGMEAIVSESEREELAQLNLKAGLKAKAAIAYAAALKYLTTGINLLPASSWLQQYDLTLALYSYATEAAFLSGNFLEMEKLAEVVLRQAKTVLDKVKVYDLKILAADVQGNLKGAIKLGLEVLQLLGVSLPAAPTGVDIQQGLAATQADLAGHNIEDLINLPLMADPSKLAAIKILVRLVPPSYRAQPELFLLLGYEQVKLSVKYGNASLSGCGYGDYGIILIGLCNDIESGYRFGEMALALMDTLKTQEVKSQVLVKVGAFTRHWKHHAQETLGIFEQATSLAIATGEIEEAGFALGFASIYSYFSGLDLTEVEGKLKKYRGTLIYLHQQGVLNYNSIFSQVILNLQQISNQPWELVGELYNERSSLPALLAAKDGVGIFNFYLSKLSLAYLFGNFREAVENSKLAAPYLGSVTAMLSVPLFYFYESLAYLGVFGDATEAEKEEIITKVSENQGKMRLWAEHGPRNHQHKFDLVEAEKHRVLGAYVEAMEYYDRAIAGAGENDYHNEEAIAGELAAKFYLGWGKPKIAQTYLIDSYYAYCRWGAKAKLADLEQCYPQLLAPIINQKKPQSRQTITDITNTNVTNTSSGTGELLDLEAVVKASQAISGAIRLEQLLSTLMELALENAGASKGALALVAQDDITIEAVAIADDIAEKSSSVSISSPEELPMTILNYVRRTLEPLVFGDATKETNWSSDSYIIQHRPKSLLCTPIVNGGKPIGILYLENNLTAGAFTPERLEILNILSAQAAISIENARFYQTLEGKVNQRTAELATANLQLAEANQEIAALNDKLQADNLRMSAELDVTRRLQQMLLPTPEELAQIPGLEIAGFMEPAAEVGGDYYDVLPHSSGVKIGIGDVTGHGLESGMLMLMAQMGVRTLLASEQNHPGEFLTFLNTAIFGNLQRMNSDKNMTLAVVDYRDRHLKISGQHEEIILVRATGQVERIDTIDLGFPLGLVDNIADFVATAEVRLNPGDVVLLYTDGIPEAIDINGVEYGLHRLISVVVENVHRTAGEIKQAIIHSLYQHMGQQKVYDDITFLVLKQQ
ncbi:MAG: AAA family ATPase [Oscillatoriaceae cyanobacterium]